MKERPILFSAPMVRAILAGTKTQTRRVVKPQPVVNGRVFKWAGPRPKARRCTGATFCNDPSEQHKDPPITHDCPYGRSGDRLWVRETWSSAVGAAERTPVEVVEQKWPIWYCADGERRFLGASEGGPAFMEREQCWRPSIHMPRWASRITLEITGVRVERLCDISEKDAKAEGVLKQRLDDLEPPTHWRGFKGVWESINGSGSWDANPWVWVVEFRRMP